MKKKDKKKIACIAGIIFVMTSNSTCIAADASQDTESQTEVEVVETVNDDELEEGFISEEYDIYKKIESGYRGLMNELRTCDDKKEWYLKYKDFVKEYEGYSGLPETVYDVFTYDEIYYMCRVVETECYTGCFDAKVNVASVLFNRLEHEWFPDNMISIVTAPGQFAYCKTNISEDTRLAVEYAFEIEDPTNGALFFHSNYKTSTFCSADYIFTDIVGHHFYKFREGMVWV